MHGRYTSRRTVDPVHTTITERPCAEWPVLIKHHHEGYITWADYLANEARLAANRTNAGARPPREGGALRQGIIYCGSCGKPMRTSYHTDTRPAYECSRADRLTTPACRSVAAATVDDAVAGVLLDALTPGQVAHRQTQPVPAVEMVHQLGLVTPATELAGQLNAAGMVTGNGRPFDAKAVQWIRHACHIPQSGAYRGQAAMGASWQARHVVSLNGHSTDCRSDGRLLGILASFTVGISSQMSRRGPMCAVRWRKLKLGSRGCTQEAQLDLTRNDGSHRTIQTPIQSVGRTLYAYLETVVR